LKTGELNVRGDVKVVEMLLRFPGEGGFDRNGADRAGGKRRNGLR